MSTKNFNAALQRYYDTRTEEDHEAVLNAFGLMLIGSEEIVPLQRVGSRQRWSVRTDLGEALCSSSDEVSGVVDLAMRDGATVITIERRKAATCPNL